MSKRDNEINGILYGGTWKTDSRGRSVPAASSGCALVLLAYGGVATVLSSSTWLALSGWLA